MDLFSSSLLLLILGIGVLVWMQKIRERVARRMVERWARVEGLVVQDLRLAGSSWWHENYVLRARRSEDGVDCLVKARVDGFVPTRVRFDFDASVEHPLGLEPRADSNLR